MTHSQFNDPQHWKNRADEMRALADGIKDAEAKATMLRLADDYEVLAQRAAERAHGIPNIATTW